MSKPWSPSINLDANKKVTYHQWVTGCNFEDIFWLIKQWRLRWNAASAAFHPGAHYFSKYFRSHQHKGITSLRSSSCRSPSPTSHRQKFEWRNHITINGSMHVRDYLKTHTSTKDRYLLNSQWNPDEVPTPMWHSVRVRTVCKSTQLEAISLQNR